VVDWDEMVTVGRIARAHGLRGQVVVNPETDFVETRFAIGATVWTREGHEPLRIVSFRLQGGRPVVGFEGRPRVEDVEALAGLELRVPEESLQPLEPGSFYHHQLVGCLVEDIHGAPIGRVRRVEGGAGGSLLVVEGVRGEVLVPLAAEICVEVDVAGGRIRIDPPEGLLELNERGAGR